MSLLAALALAALAPAVLLAAAASQRARRFEKALALTRDKLEQVQRHFEQFAPPDVVEQVAAHGSYPAQRRQVTMLFADLRGFTALCDRLDPAVTVSVLNGYFRRMSGVIDRHHGHLNELVGDGLLALFGALEPNPWQARDSVLAALEMREALARYNEELRASSLPELRFGIGIHSGEVVAGLMGAGALHKFSVTGDPINVAARVESLTVAHGVDLLVTEEIRRTLDAHFILHAMPPARVKGKPEPIVTYFVEGVRAPAGQ